MPQSSEGRQLSRPRTKRSRERAFEHIATNPQIGLAARRVDLGDGVGSAYPVQPTVSTPGARATAALAHLLARALRSQRVALFPTASMARGVVARGSPMRAR